MGRSLLVRCALAPGAAVLAACAALAGDWREWPRDEPFDAQASADCPPDLVLECDGAGNLVERQAWLDLFGGAPSAGCGAVTRSLQPTPGVLLAQLAHPDFADLSAWTLNGVTGLVGNPVSSGGRSVLRLTNALSQAGSAFITNPVTLDLDASFSAVFSFQIALPQGASDPDGVGADGLVFVVQTVANTAGGLGGGIGYQGIAPSLGVEVDTWDNGAWDDFDGNHVGINLSGNIDSATQAPVWPRMNDGDIWFAWVDYDGVADLLEVRVDRSHARPAAPLLQLAVDLAAVLGSADAFVGFTSGTGAAGGWHDILTFHFVNTRRGTGCGGTGTETIVSTIVDDCGNLASCARMLTLVDTTRPALSASPLPACLASQAEAEAAAVAATAAADACSGPVTLAASTSGSCDAVVTVTATDECGNVGTLDHPVRLDPAPPSLAPAGGILSCGGILHVVSSNGVDATASPAVALTDACGASVVTNDRTAGGLDATATYPCGLSVVTFEAVDECGRVATCAVGVLVEPLADPGDVGPSLRVRKNASGTPVLDWSLAAPGAGPRFSVLRSDAGPSTLTVFPPARDPGAPLWTETAPSPRFLCYDVRGTDCAGRLSAD